MDLVGGYLKSVREEKNIKLDTLVKELNISRDFLEAIERDDFSVTPGPVYSIGYIRTISNYFELDTNKLIQDYKNQIAFSQNNEKIEINKPIENFNLFKTYKIFSYVSVFSISIFFYFVFFQNNDLSNNEYANIPDVPENLESIIEEADLEIALSNIDDIKKEGNIVTNENEILISKDNLNLKDEKKSNKIYNTSSAVASKPQLSDTLSIKDRITIKSIGSTWMQLRNSKEEIIYSKLMEQNDEFSYSLSDGYRITTGDAGNIIVSINGIVKGKLGKRGEVLESFIVLSDFNN